jgi:hypothetical protein
LAIAAAAVATGSVSIATAFENDPDIAHANTASENIVSSKTFNLFVEAIIASESFAVR